MEKTIFVLEDDADARGALCTILESGGYKRVCFANETGLLESTRQRSPLAILLDVNLPGRSGLDVLKDLTAYSVPVVIISGDGDIPTAVAAIKNGALDVIETPFKREDILDRLENIAAGASGDPHEPPRQKLESFHFPGCEPLTRRERDILQLAATGSTNKEISEVLGISYRTVEDHRSNIVHKLGVRNIADLLIIMLK